LNKSFLWILYFFSELNKLKILLILILIYEIKPAKMTFKDYIENQLLNNEFVINLENFPGCISKWDFNYLLDFLKNNNHIGHVIHKKK